MSRKKLESEERLITAYGGIRVRMDLDRVPLWSERCDVDGRRIVEGVLPVPVHATLASFDVLVRAISDGVSKIDWQTETFAYADGHDGDRWVGLTVAQHVNADRADFSSTPTLHRRRSR